MAIEMEKSKPKIGGLNIIMTIFFLVVIVSVFFSFKKSIITNVDKIDISKILNKDVKELDKVDKNLDVNVQSIMQDPNFNQLKSHSSEILLETVGKVNPFQP